MWRWRRQLSLVGVGRIVAAVGVVYVALGAARALRLTTAGAGVGGAAVEFLLLAAPGGVLVYGGYRLPRSTVSAEIGPRVLQWLFGAVALALGVVGVLLVNPAGSVDRPLRAAAIATALGSVAGVAIGGHEARAISRARQAERRRDELRRERDLRDRIVETSPVGIAVVDADGSISFANDRAAAIVGIEPEKLTFLRYDESMFLGDGASGADWSREEESGAGEAGEEASGTNGSSGEAPGTNESEDDLFERVLATGEPVYGEEHVITRGDGQEIWISINAAPLSGPRGDVDAVVFAFRDVTEQKRLAAENERRIERLRTSNRRLQEFARAASHDLQEPLRMVSTYLQLLERRYGDDLADEAREYLSTAVDSADRMRSMVESLHEYSRVATEEGTLEAVDAGAVLEDALQELQPRLEATDATVTTEDLPTVYADPDRLALVFGNLLSNALRYSGDEPPEIHVGAERTDDGWQFRVSDEGIGIEPEQHERIFEVFQRLHTDAEQEGTGVGLALCERIVERHGGEMDVRSEPGQGATFTFTLPADADRQPQTAR